MEKKEIKINRTFVDIVKRFLLPFLSLLLVIGSFLFLTYSHTSNHLFSNFTSKYKVGDLVLENVKAPFSFTFVDEKKTNEKINAALASVLPIYRVSLSATLTDVKVANNDTLDALNKGIFDKKELEVSRNQGYDSITLVSDIDGIETKKTVKISECLTLDSFKNFRNIQPNVHYDKVLTATEREKAASLVPLNTVRVEKGDVLVYKDSIVTDETLSLLKNIRESTSVYNLTKKVVVIVFIIFLFVGFFFLFSYILNGNRRERLFINTIYVSVGLFVALVCFTYPYVSSLLNTLSYDLILPQFLIPLVVLYISGNKRLSLSSVLFISSILAFMPFSEMYASIRYFFSGFFAVEFLYYTTSRIEKLVNYIMVFLLEVFVSIITLTVSGSSLYTILHGSLAVSIVFIVGQALALAISIVLEKAFNLPTPYRLNELINKKTPLLERFEQLCPGSYDHSLAVEKLAVAASDELSLNTPLVRLSSMYHDVGKMEHPLYFIENQTDENKHDALTSELSASTIRSHVALGVKLAKSAHLPDEVIDIIGEHHGNDTINYFYYEAQKQREEQGGQKEDVNESDFAYSALPPSSKEAAVVMLSDISEAAVRSAKNAAIKRGEGIDEDMIRGVIHRLFMSKLEKHQLSDSTLTIGELEKIENLFISKLVSDNHSRIEYKKPSETSEKEENENDKS